MKLMENNIYIYIYNNILKNKNSLKIRGIMELTEKNLLKDYIKLEFE